MIKDAEIIHWINKVETKHYTISYIFDSRFKKYTGDVTFISSDKQTKTYPITTYSLAEFHKRAEAITKRINDLAGLYYA